LILFLLFFRLEIGRLSSGSLVMAKDIQAINLLPNKGERLASQFFTWIFTIGRLLIILTETLALSVFLYRFSLDMRIVDLHDQLRSASIIVQNFGSSEQKFRNLQNRLQLAKQYDEQSKQLPQLTQKIMALGEKKITFNNLSITNTTIAIEAQASSSQALSDFTTSLQSFPEIQSLSIDRVENKTATAITIVNLSATLKKQASLKGEAL
jgi:hypothetical protein